MRFDTWLWPLIPLILFSVFLVKVIKRCLVPRKEALRQMSWRDLCLLRSDRLSQWPCLKKDFERCRSEWLEVNRHEAGRAGIAQGIEGADLTLPGLLGTQARLCRTLEGFDGLSEVADFLWQTYFFLNDSFFEGSLMVDDICVVHAGSEEGAEACVKVDFSEDCTSAVLWIEFDWRCCCTWTVARAASVLFHELVHVWHDSSWRASEQLVPHSWEFLRKCAALNDLCDVYALPIFPNVFTESWVILVDESLTDQLCWMPCGLKQAWKAFLECQSHFEGSFLHDLLSLGVQHGDIMAAKRQLNAGHIQQALSLGYQSFQSWRCFLAQGLMQRLAELRSLPDVFIRADYVWLPAALLHQLAQEHGLAPGLSDTLQVAKKELSLEGRARLMECSRL